MDSSAIAAPERARTRRANVFNDLLFITSKGAAPFQERQKSGQKVVQKWARQKSMGLNYHIFNTNLSIVFCTNKCSEKKTWFQFIKKAFELCTGSTMSPTAETAHHYVQYAVLSTVRTNCRHSSYCTLIRLSSKSTLSTKTRPPGQY